jgi:hypothetical protein
MKIKSDETRGIKIEVRQNNQPYAKLGTTSQRHMGGSGGIDVLILYLGTRWPVTSFMARPL